MIPYWIANWVGVVGLWTAYIVGAIAVIVVLILIIKDWYKSIFKRP